MVIKISDDDGNDSDDNIVIVTVVMIIVLKIIMMIVIGYKHEVRLVYLFGLETGSIFNAVKTFLLDSAHIIL
jgi:hypothetical protein